MVHLDKLVIVSISIYSVFSYGFECPTDVRPSIGACLSDYTAQLDGLRFTNKNFFTGADVELIRSICSCLQASVVCIRDISNNCGQSQRATINSLLFPHYTVVELCQYKNLFDDYAISQNCFHKHSIETESCLNTFELGTELTKPNDGDSSSQRLDHLRQYCSRFDALVQCVRSSLSSCGNIATTTLSELLVKATVSGSRHCKDDILNPATSSHPKQSQENNLYQNSNSAPSVNKFVEQFQFLLIFCIFISCRKLLINFC